MHPLRILTRAPHALGAAHPRPIRALRRTRSTGLLLALALATCGCRSYPPGIPLPDIIDEINATLQPDVVVLEPGDGVQVRFLNNPGNNQTVGIRPDGRANFYLLDELEVAGMTVNELGDELTRRYEESLISPELTVSLGRVAPRQILILGREGRGRLPVGNKLTIEFLEFLAKTRIPRQTTTPMQHVVLMRWMPDEGRRRIWTIDARQEYWDHPIPLLLQGGDIIFIPENSIVSAGQWMRTFMRLLPLPQFVLRQA
jgi:protein involved in polysaccharide export with SLBB domain